MPDASERIQQMMRRFEEQAQKASELQSVMQDLRGSASSADGAVKVTVAPSGAILDLQLTPQAVRRSHSDLQQAIMTTIRAATQNASEQLNGAVAPILGEEQFQQFQQAFNAQSSAIKPEASSPDASTPPTPPSQPAQGSAPSQQPTAAPSPPPQRQQDNDVDDDDFSHDSFLR